MKLLADENFDGLLVGWLRQQGHDVDWVVEQTRGILDPDVVNMASQSGRCLLTLDKGFGDLVFRQQRHLPGILLVRLDFADKPQLLAAFIQHWPRVAASLEGHFITLDERGPRMKPLPV